MVAYARDGGLPCWNLEASLALRNARTAAVRMAMSRWVSAQHGQRLRKVAQISTRDGNLMMENRQARDRLDRCPIRYSILERGLVAAEV